MNYTLLIIFLLGYATGMFIDRLWRALCWLTCMLIGHISPVFRDSGVYCTFCETWEVRYK